MISSHLSKEVDPKVYTRRRESSQAAIHSDIACAPPEIPAMELKEYYDNPQSPDQNDIAIGPPYSHRNQQAQMGSFIFRTTSERKSMILKTRQNQRISPKDLLNVLEYYAWNLNQ